MEQPSIKPIFELSRNYLKKFKYKIFVLLLLGLLGALADVLSISLLLPLLTHKSMMQELPVYNSNLFAFVAQAQELLKAVSFTSIITVFFLSMIFKELIVGALEIFRAVLRHQIEYTIRTDCSKKLMTTNFLEIDQKSEGDIFSTLSSFVGNSAAALVSITLLIPNFLMACSNIVLFLFLASKVQIYGAILIVSFIIIVSKIISSKRVKFGYKRRKARGRLDSAIQTNLLSLKYIHQLSLSNKALSILEERGHALKLVGITNAILTAATPMFQRVFSFILIFIIIIFSYKESGGDIQETVALSAILILLVGKISQPAIAISNEILNINNRAADCDAVNAIFQMHTGEQTKAESKINKNSQLMKAKNSNITLNGIKFSYPSNRNVEIVIEDVVIHSNTITHIIGPSGSGKSTLLDLICFLYPLGPGSIRFGGVPISNKNKLEWHQKIAVLPQMPIIIYGSIRENILYLNDKYSDSDIHRACVLSEFTDVLDRLPQGLDTVLDQSNSSLSGGELQRLSLARSLVGDPKILLLDEFTSNQDPRSENRLMRAIRAIAKNRMVISATHKVQQIKPNENVIFIIEGTIKAQGKHKDLIKNDISYQKFFNASL